MRPARAVLLLLIVHLLLCCAAASRLDEYEALRQSLFPATSEPPLSSASPSFTPLLLDVDESPASSFSSSHSFSPLSLISPSSSSPESWDDAYHNFLVLGTTAGNADELSFSVSGQRHRMLQGAPATFSDVFLTITDESAQDGNSSYSGELSFNISCDANGTMTLLLPDDVALQAADGDAALSNGSVSFSSAQLSGNVSGINVALSLLTFTPISPLYDGNSTCAFIVEAEAQQYAGDFLFIVLPVATLPSADAVYAAFNLSVSPPVTSQYSLYTGLASDIASVLYTSVDRVVVTSVIIFPTYTAVDVSFLPVPDSTLAGGSVMVNATAAALFAAFVALTPAEMSGTVWLRYVEPGSIHQVCGGEYSASCAATTAPAAIAAAAALTITSSIAFIVSLAVGGCVVVTVVSAVIYRRMTRALPVPLSPVSVSGQRSQARVDNVPSVLSAGSASNRLALAQALGLATDEDELSASSLPSSQRSRSKRGAKGSRVRLKVGAGAEGGDQLAQDLLEKLRAMNGGEARRYVYQPPVLLSDEHTLALMERRHSIRDIIISEPALDPERQPGVVIGTRFRSELRAAESDSQPASSRQSFSHIPPLVAGRSVEQQQHGDDDSDDDGPDFQGPRFVDAEAQDVMVASPPELSATASPRSFPSFSSPSVGHDDVRIDMEGKRPSLLQHRLSASSKRGSGISQHAAALPGPEAAVDGEHIDYAALDLEMLENGGSRTPSISMQELANDWLAAGDDEHQPSAPPLSRFSLEPAPLGLSGLYQQSALLASQAPSVQASPSLRPMSSRPSLPPMPLFAASKRVSWSAAKRASGGKIALDLSKAGELYTVPAPASDQSVMSGKPAQAKANTTSSATTASAVKGLAGIGAAVKGWGLGRAGAGRLQSQHQQPLLSSLSPLHHPRMSLYGQ